jgi:GT2 family glycosyltransferase
MAGVDQHARPLVTIAFNQGRFLDEALTSIFEQDLPVEVYVAVAGSTDGSIEIVRKFEHRLAGWRSHPDGGQAAAINESIARGRAPYVGWLNSDDCLLPGGLTLTTSGFFRFSNSCGKGMPCTSGRSRLRGA